MVCVCEWFSCCDSLGTECHTATVTQSVSCTIDDDVDVVVVRPLMTNYVFITCLLSKRVYIYMYIIIIIGNENRLSPASN